LHRDRISATQDEDRFLFLSPLLLLCFRRQLRNDALAPRRADGSDGAGVASAAPPGRQTSAPSSIRLCVKSPRPSSGYSRLSMAATFSFCEGALTGAASPVRRAVTRSTLPSTAGVASSKQMEAMAPAV
jgi:hypothetical protein